MRLRQAFGCQLKKIDVLHLNLNKNSFDTEFGPSFGDIFVVKVLNPEYDDFQRRHPGNSFQLSRTNVLAKELTKLMLLSMTVRREMVGERRFRQCHLRYW